jgi:hypothetical protein
MEGVWGSWDETHWERFFRGHFEPSLTRIVVVNGRDVGVLRLEERVEQVPQAL